MQIGFFFAVFFPPFYVMVMYLFLSLCLCLSFFLFSLTFSHYFWRYHYVAIKWLTVYLYNQGASNASPLSVMTRALYHCTGLMFSEWNGCQKVIHLWWLKGDIAFWLCDWQMAMALEVEGFKQLLSLCVCVSVCLCYTPTHRDHMSISKDNRKCIQLFHIFIWSQMYC